MTLLLRDAVAGDAGVILAFVRHLADYEKLSHEVHATEAVLHEELFGPAPRAFALLAERDAVAVGFAVWFYSFSTFTGRASLFVEDVFVLPEHRKAGIGRAIFADLARRTLAARCERMDWSVLDWNAPAIEFYRGIGARPVRDWTMQRLTGEALTALAGEM